MMKPDAVVASERGSEHRAGNTPATGIAVFEKP